MIVIPIAIWTCPLTADVIGNRSYFALKLVPIPADAYNYGEATEDSISHWWSIYETEWEVEEVIDYYEKILPQRGWRFEVLTRDAWHCIKAIHFTFTTVNISIVKITGQSDTRVLINLPPRQTMCEL